VKHLLLWDIDGTLLASGGSGMRALRIALGNVFAVDGSLDDIDWSGRTDRFILRQILEKFSLPTTSENFDRLLDGYINLLPEELNRSARILPGVKALLDTAAARADVSQGLLTGNIDRGAKAKLIHHGLWDYFPFGAFANDSELRNDLGPFAMRRATAHTGVTFAPEQVWIIGDTPHDIECGKVIGARTLAVATGRHPIEELIGHAPTAAFKDLADAELFWRTIES
jgi:phosphoglycolate phosphatase-like HAD superfamily hydrolase